MIWRLRGILDKMVGGVGLRRGRRNATHLIPGDALDFWRVLIADRNNMRLLLFAEMKVPGDAWLEFRIMKEEDAKGEEIKHTEQTLYMEQTGLLVMGTGINIWFIIAAALFLFLVLAFLFNFFSVFLNFLQAQGCFAAVLVGLISLPGIFILCPAAGYTVTATILILLSVIGAITGYIVRDTEGNVGKFGFFFMILSILTLLVALIASRFFHLF
jgi:hypothetical protein